MSIEKKYGDPFAKSRRSLAYWTQIARRDFTEELLRWMETRGVDSIPWIIVSAAIIASGVSVASRLGWL